MQRRLIPFPNQSEEEYQAWLKQKGYTPWKWLKNSDLIWIQQQRRERKTDAIFHAIHCTDRCGCGWRKKHN